MRSAFRTIVIVSGIGALLFTLGVTFGLWSVWGIPSTWAYLSGYGACVLVHLAGRYMGLGGGSWW